MHTTDIQQDINDIHTYIHADCKQKTTIHRNIQTDIKVDKQTDIQIYIHNPTYTQTGRQKDSTTEKQSNRQTHSQTNIRANSFQGQPLGSASWHCKASTFFIRNQFH